MKACGPPHGSQVILITGASDGIGAEMARQLAQTHGRGLQLVLAARTAAKLDAVAHACQRWGAQTLCLPTDVSDPQACRALIATTLAHCGRLDALINNAGVSAHALLEEVSSADLAWYEALMRINLWSSVWCTHAALPALRASGGRIVAVSSLAGLVGVPGRTAYSASKFAMTGFFEALRTELRGSGVSVTLAYPGVVQTAIRSNGWNAQGRTAGVSGLKEDRAMPVDTCARIILRAMQARQREAVMTPLGKAARWLKLLWPDLVERKAWAALHRQTPANHPGPTEKNTQR